MVHKIYESEAMLIMNREQILSMIPGPELDALVIKEIDNLVSMEVDFGAVSTDDIAALKLRGELTILGLYICNIRFGDLPKLISEGCIITDDEDDSKSVNFASSSFAESMAKAFLLFVNEHYGEHLHPEFAIKVDSASVRGIASETRSV